MKKNNCFNITIIVPVYNTEYYLEDTISCIKCQTEQNFELILIDDGSTDNSGQIIDQLAETDSRIVAIHQKNSGQAAARNVGIKHARADVITFIDSDDLVSPLYLEHLLKGFTTPDVEITSIKKESFLIKPHELKSSHILWIKKYDSKHFLNAVFFHNDDLYYVSFWGKAFKSSFLKSQVIAEGHYYEDMANIPVIISNAHTIMLLNSQDYFYRENREESTLNSFNEKTCNDLLWALKYIRKNVIFNKKLEKSYNILLFNNISFIWIWCIKNKRNYRFIFSFLDRMSFNSMLLMSLKTHVSRKGMLLWFCHKLHLI
ncbi:hypothetical protein DS831_08390 [Bombilactobacillus bombi]|uniref:Glycosyltransferase 2-like domain-containing protein n=1 Tax=Bombilactobacillus bombi TaxID=1303590 RepID=A0A3R6ZXM3_9LACO|nr:glycosyltransferase family A protein [Bombilactobacillus bombi]RHW50165.1 hypothetical protein DS831_08390 [Bombilactobacillus bombi]